MRFSFYILSGLRLSILCSRSSATTLIMKKNQQNNFIDFVKMNSSIPINWEIHPPTRTPPPPKQTNSSENRISVIRFFKRKSYCIRMSIAMRKLIDIVYILYDYKFGQKAFFQV